MPSPPVACPRLHLHALAPICARARPPHFVFRAQVAGRKQRELYVGNLLQGVVTDVMLKEFFTSVSGARAEAVL
eukprot:1537599-Pleurochrysis_carterae.AAC.1